ncbi:MAG TPA: acyl-CoA thioesterase, partial [Arachnia sp.]|nr:acyl-CoA thioesterase [Arachnia sp.]
MIIFAFDCPLRWSDLDAQGHVNNAVIVDYLQEARVAFLRQGPASALLDSGIIVVSHQVEFRGSIP